MRFMMMVLLNLGVVACSSSSVRQVEHEHVTLFEITCEKSDGWPKCKDRMVRHCGADFISLGTEMDEHSYRVRFSCPTTGSSTAVCTEANGSASSSSDIAKLLLIGMTAQRRACGDDRN